MTRLSVAMGDEMIYILQLCLWPSISDVNVKGLIVDCYAEMRGPANDWNK